jgi:hypothetical protein
MTVFFRKTEIGAQTMPDVVTVKDKRPAAGLVQSFFNCVSNG